MARRLAFGHLATSAVVAAAVGIGVLGAGWLPVALGSGGLAVATSRSAVSTRPRRTRLSTMAPVLDAATREHAPAA